LECDPTERPGRPRKSKFSEEQIIAILREQEAAITVRRAAYASALLGEISRHVPRGGGSARRALATHGREGSDQPELALPLDEKEGPQHRA
jgi:hypothetical protein